MDGDGKEMVNTMKNENFKLPGIQRYDDIIQDEIGRRIKECRLARHMTPSHLACAMCYETTSPISKIENGDMCLSIDRLYELSQILDVSTDYLLFGDQRQRYYDDIIGKMEDLDLIELDVINNFLGDIISKLGEGAVV